MSANPYLKKGRLPDVIAAITALGNYRYYKLSFEKCAERISNDPSASKKWEQIFREHPEFFRVTENHASLVWRRQLPKLFDPKKMDEITRDQFEKLEKGAKDKITRKPLEAEQINALINTATDLHQRALDQQTASRYWIPIVTAVLAFIGAVVGALISAGW